MKAVATKIFSLSLLLAFIFTPLFTQAATSSFPTGSTSGGYSTGGYGSRGVSAPADLNSTIGNVGIQSGLPYNSVSGILLNFLLWLLRIFTIIAVLSFIIAGIMFLFAGANKGLADKAKAAIGYSIMGLVVALSAYIIILLVAELLWGGMGTGGGGFLFF